MVEVGGIACKLLLKGAVLDNLRSPAGYAGYGAYRAPALRCGAAGRLRGSWLPGQWLVGWLRAYGWPGHCSNRG